MERKFTFKKSPKILLEKSARIILLLAVFVFIILFSFGFLGGDFGKSNEVQAQTPGMQFGGLTVATIPCLCSLSMYLAVTPPLANPAVGGTYVFQLGFSIPYLYYEIFLPGAFVLGTALPGEGTCYFFVPVPPACVYIPVATPGGEITQIGTSLL